MILVTAAASADAACVAFAARADTHGSDPSPRPTRLRTHMTDTPDPAISSSADLGDDGPWALPEQEPTNLIALWPGRHAPVLTEVISALSATCHGEVRVVEEISSEEREFQWAVVIEIEGRNGTMVLWLDAAKPLSDEQKELFGCDDPHWVIGVELRLDADDPLTDFMRTMQVTASAFPDVPAVLDVNAARWYTRVDLESVFCNDEVEPPVEVLWVIQAVQTDEEDPAARSTWLHTHGLWRCGVPELEMIEVPGDRADCAAELMNDVAGLLLERQPPKPGEAFEIGTNLSVVLQPWEVVAPYVAPGCPGGMDDRSGAHLGIRAAICADVPEGSYRKLWVWPRDVVHRLMNDEAGVYMTRRATERQGRLARSNYGQLATAFATWGKTAARLNGELDSVRVVFGIKAGFTVDHDTAVREHLWFEVKQFDGDRVEAELVNHPLSVTHIAHGDVVWLSREEISDWLVMTPCGCFGPNNIDALWRAIDAIRGQIDELLPE